MKPDEFWSSTPRELAELADGYSWRDRRNWEHTAYLASVIMNFAGKQSRRRIKPEELLRADGGHDPIAQHMKLRQVMEKLEKRKHNGV